MSKQKDKPGDIERLLEGASAADIERLTQALIARAAAGSPVSVTTIGGNVINSAVGSGASLTAQEVIALLGADSSTARADAERQAAARLERALLQRNLADAQSPAFGQTNYSKWMQMTDVQGRPAPIRTVGFYFAQTTSPLVMQADKKHFAGWMDVNKRRYDPIRVPYFLPGPFPQRISKGHVWHNGHLARFPQPSQSYFTYLAAELDDGFIEYGFCAGDLHPPFKNGVSYSRAVAGFVCFLRFIQDMANTFGGDLAKTSVGFAIRGTKGTVLKQYTDPNIETRCAAPPIDQDGFLWRRPADGTTWVPDAVARSAAVGLLDHWSILPPPGSEEPEFESGKYTGKYYKYYCNGDWA